VLISCSNCIHDIDCETKFWLDGTRPSGEREGQGCCIDWACCTDLDTQVCEESLEYLEECRYDT
jgi:hypothetical protein